ncbi:MAG: hypothetical protein TREMPRED_002262 [Tremellales sp. Tagirdzhanova-0007]|nr:MAG: hypothetical protein TREMPRED_002262 [Tremellales sp. Tagirdzhanova-0007]
MPTVLITGANRGVGLGFVHAFLEKGYTVIAAIRDVSKMPKLDGVITVKIAADSKTDAKQAMEDLRSTHKITTLDIVIANAAINPSGEHFKDTDPEDMEAAWRVNVLGPLILFQATLPFQPAGSKFIVISSGAGTIDREHRLGSGAYGHSKAAVNFIVRKLHFEHPDLIVLSLDPGGVRTEMGNRGAIWMGMEESTKEVSDHMPTGYSAGMMRVIEHAEKTTTSGYMIFHDGSRMAF